MNNNLLRKIGKHWSKQTEYQQKNSGLKLRWWQSKFVIKHINQTVCGSPVDGVSQGIINLAKQIAGEKIPLEHGISVGGGNGQKEMNLIRQKVVSRFTIYELAEARIEQGKELAKKLGIEDKVQFILGDAFQLEQESEKFDFIHWNNSLHHMLDVDSALSWSRSILKKGGMFYLDDYVGPNRMQWSDKMLEIASYARNILPEKFLIDPRNPDKLVSRVCKRPDLEKLIKSDPSECADSEKILTQVQKYFPNAVIKLTGGVIYHLALNDIIHNFDEIQDKPLLDLLMMIDKLCIDLGETHYAIALAFK
ncbi:MAG: methyltransferase domain-containing protein [Xenococcaceae cyanobacterium MO_188.B29]|nr:methyltransferase domain-containing protein [Xenococcaceae cyanobacterium MO_188.B29]